MNTVKNVFSIKDLENLSGIKAHTIRIWEKRYGILEPIRTETNIRVYDIQNLQKLLNITFLHNYGIKISKIATLPAQEIQDKVKEIVTEKNVNNLSLNSFKLAMMNFDQRLFLDTYNQLIEEKSFREIFFQVFVPLLVELGVLWQTETISPAHEHFISHLIKQKLLIHIEKAQSFEIQEKDELFILYLPNNEIHELGLMYLNYELLIQGKKTIYLGPNIPVDSLIDIQKYFDPITFVTYITVEPSPENINDYLLHIKENVFKDNNNKLWVFGRMVSHINPNLVDDRVRVFQSINTLQES